MFDQALDRCKTAIAHHEDHIVGRILLQHKIAERPKQADRIIGLDRPGKQTAGKRIGFVATDMQQDIAVVAGAGGNRILAAEIGGAAGD